MSYPINLDVAGKSCVVVGGGKVALRKILGLLEAGARVKVIAPEICAQVKELFKRGEILWTREKFSAELLGDEFILIAATNSAEINRQAAEVAQAKKILVNVVNSSGGNFNVPSRIRRGDFLLTISTGANSPAFAKFVRENLEAELGENFGAGLEIISRTRREVKQLLPNQSAREKFWREVLTAQVWQLLKSGKLDKLKIFFETATNSLRQSLIRGDKI
ncbi:MAG: bifunctional precorrin-2 dehydrogenase/sirohydrochlorin ferrochelatase [Selenomonadaceae bacterium]|nr:bifunctional precorrin-2 dehydrogenase/sirohydrochlorin ferrochelatase [Selenomonadaceae bacterium]